MKRSILICAIIIAGLISCNIENENENDNNVAHRPDNPFIYAILNNATVIYGKDTVNWPVDPSITVNDRVRVIANRKPCRILKIDYSKKFKHIILPWSDLYIADITEYAKKPYVFKAYSSGDTLILCHTDTLDFYRPIPNSYKGFRRAKAIDYKNGDAISFMVKDTYAVGDSIDNYTIVSLVPFIRNLVVDLPEEIEAISSDPTHPDLLQIDQTNTGVELGFYHPKK